VEVPVRDAGREVCHLSVVLAPVRDATDRSDAVAVIARDITEVRRLRQARSRLRAELTQAQRVASLGRLVQTVAHDFNNVLTAIHGFATLAAADLDGRPRDDQLEIIRAAERGSDLARQLLVQARGGPSMAVPVAIDDALGGCARMLRRLLPPRVELVLRLEADSMVAIDPIEVDQVLMNLVLNARDAMGGAGLIVVETRCVDAPVDATGGSGGPAAVLLSVTDTGPGMDAAVRERAFEPYFTTKGPGAGTGLGLATVREIVERAGGSIDLVTTPGGGTALTVRLPAAR
jgi:signal transduction histidine kinase